MTSMTPGEREKYLYATMAGSSVLILALSVTGLAGLVAGPYAMAAGLCASAPVAFAVWLAAYRAVS